jgi:hypothetical protein
LKSLFAQTGDVRRRAGAENEGINLESKKGGIGMCLSCGCGKPDDDHGNPKNITQQDLDEAAQAANISPEEAARNISEGHKQTADMR